jgi:hypothetical protein
MLWTRNWVGWTPTQLMSVHVTGKRLGILGIGRTPALADRAAAASDPLQQPQRLRSTRRATSHANPTTCCPCDFCRSTRR